MADAALVSIDGGGFHDRVKNLGPPGCFDFLLEVAMYFPEGWVRRCFGPIASGEQFWG